MIIEKLTEKKSRLVKDSDVEKVYKLSEEMLKLMKKPHGIYDIFYAISHVQVERSDPMRFFVLNNMMEDSKRVKGIVVINPVMTRHSNMKCESKEGCMSFSNIPMTTVERWTKCEVEYSPLEFREDKENKRMVPLIGKRQTINLSGRLAKIFQHEIDHLNGKNIYQ